MSKIELKHIDKFYGKNHVLKDPKECSEHVMLVDLGRNDLGRVAKPGSVKLERLMEMCIRDRCRKPAWTPWARERGAA